MKKTVVLFLGIGLLPGMATAAAPDDITMEVVGSEDAAVNKRIELPAAVKERAREQKALGADIAGSQASERNAMDTDAAKQARERVRQHAESGKGVVDKEDMLAAREQIREQRREAQEAQKQMQQEMQEQIQQEMQNQMQEEMQQYSQEQVQPGIR